MDIDLTVRRAQIYGFFAQVFLYPRENWSQDLAVLRDHLLALGIPWCMKEHKAYRLEELQHVFRQTFGLSGSLCYETEYGLPHEFRMSQELADIAGFYRAFGVRCGGAVQERPDHIAVECEFMHLVCLKEAWSAHQKQEEAMELCREAERKFLADHLGRWIPFFVKSLAMHGEALFLDLAQQFQAFLHWEARFLGIQIQVGHPDSLKPTPMEQNWSCEDCEASQATMCLSGGVS